MPLVIVCGLPCSGKTTFSKALKAHIDRNYPAYKSCLINEETLSLSKAVSYLGTSVCILYPGLDVRRCG